MALRLSRTGTRNQLFLDFQTVMGTTMGWVLFDNVSATRKVYTLPASNGQGPAFIELLENTSTHTVYLRIWQSWDEPSDTGTGDAPNVIDSTNVNGIDFVSDISTQSYRIFAGARYLAVTTEGVSSNTSGIWCGLLTTLSTAINYVVPVALISVPSNGVSYKGYWRTDAGVAFSNTLMDPFDLAGMSTTTENTSGKTPAMAVWCFGSGAQRQIPGFADDALHIPGGADFDDIVSISGASYRAAGGGVLAFLV